MMELGTTIRVGLLAFSLGAALGACDSGAFSCAEHAECVDGTRVGLCQPDGWCSFTDMDCPSLQRYGDLSAEDIAGTCVPEAPQPQGDAADGGGIDDGPGDGPELELAVEDDDDTPGDDDVDGLPEDGCPNDPALSLCLRFARVDGGTVQDDADPAIMGQLVGDAAIGEGIFGNALTLPGSDGHLALGDRLDPAGSFSIDTWVWLEADSPPWAGIVDKWKRDKGFWLGGAGQPGGLSFWVDGSYVSIADAPMEEWIHVTATYDVDSGDMSLFVDGELVALGQHSGPATTTDRDLVLGWGVEDEARMHGQLDSVRLWNRVLSPNEL